MDSDASNFEENLPYRTKWSGGSTQFFRDFEQIIIAKV
jgi:hypothetical protein